MTLAVAALPPELRASLPAELRGLRRDHVRLMVVDRSAGEVRHTRFDALGELLAAGDLLVVNTSRTLAAAVPATREDGTVVQLRPCVRRDGHWDALAVEPAPPHRNVPLLPGERLVAAGLPLGVVEGRRPDIPLLWRIHVELPDIALITAVGEPIRYSYVPESVPLEHYQTVFATRPGSAETPSAGRAFSWEQVLALRGAGVAFADIVLHTGLSSYQDDDFDLEHRLYEEWFEVPEATLQAARAARRVIAVGTTVVRALETAASAGARGGVSGWTDLAIRPGSPLRAVDGLLTGLHEPQASHWDLLRAFVAEPLLERAYGEAVQRRYLWHEFGDTMLVL